jgi:hypothetical protein
MKLKAKILLIGLFTSGAAIANCPDHNSVVYQCDVFQNNIKCTWKPKNGWYQGSTNSGDVPIPPTSKADRFHQAFWTPNGHITPDGLSYGVTICEYGYKDQIFQLYQTDRDPNIPDPRQDNPKFWFPGPWQDAKGYICGPETLAGPATTERDCKFAYGEQS